MSLYVDLHLRLLMSLLLFAEEVLLCVFKLFDLSSNCLLPDSSICIILNFMLALDHVWVTTIN